MSPIRPIRLISLLALLSLLSLPASAQTIGGNVYGGGEQGEVAGNADVTIKNGTLGSLNGNASVNGNVYGGGNAGNLKGHTTVTLQGGNIYGSVFGGAQQADVKKYTYVNIDGANQLHDLTVNRVYGGNDVSGVIGADQGGTEGQTSGVPISTIDANNGTIYVDNTFQTFIQATPERKITVDNTETQLHTFIGQMFGGGNGDYDYETESTEQNPNPYYGKTAPTVAKAYMQANGGTYGYVFAGGNNATVTEKAVISLNNTSAISTATTHLDLTAMTSLATIMSGGGNDNNPVDLRLLSMGINLSTFHTGHHFTRVFGGNNKTDMAIMPHWNLAKGSIHDLYSGGNEGRMTYQKGILLEIKENSEIIAENVYGGCRKADVYPMKDGEPSGNSDIQIEGYHFPAGFSARVLVRGGTIRNVYGGNDISGNVTGGNAVGIYTSILGDVYGGGNGSYAYTDNDSLKNDLIWGDYYYDPGSSSIDSLNAHRPNAEQVSLRLWGKADKKTIIGGSVYVGGNSASLSSAKTNPIAELKIGSYVIAENVFLGNNGENMVDASETGVLRTYANSQMMAADKHKYDFSSLTLTDATQFAKYMDGCAMHINPRIVFDGDATTDAETYQEYTSYFGSFFGGGNVGSIVASGLTTLNFDKKITIYNKLVGGCNNANVPAHEGLNAAYNGGILGSSAEQAENGFVDGNGKIRDRLVLNLSSVKLKPLRWKVKAMATQPSVGSNVTDLFYVDADGNFVKETNEDAVAVSGRTYYEYDRDGSSQPQLQYNVYKNGTPEIPYSVPATTGSKPSDDDKARRLVGANVYGGCYNSGHVNGNVVINLNSTIHDREEIFDETNAPANAKLYAYDDYTITTRHTGVLLGYQAMDVSVSALGVYGGGYGENSEVWGSATVNLNKGFTFQVYGGGEKGIIGKASDNPVYNSAYSTYSNLNGSLAGDASTVSEDMAEAEFFYGGAFKGLVLGDTHVNLGNGRVFNSIGGSCAADIYGHSELYMGRGSNDDSNQGFPWVIDYVYGGNDVAGEIKNTADFTSRVSETALPMVYGYDANTNPTPAVTQASAYVEYQQGRVENIFGGSCGDFDYTNDSYYKTFADNDQLPFVDNAFVNFKPLVDKSSNSVAAIFGGSQGHEGGAYKDKMQNRSYVLVDVPQSMTTFATTEVFGSGAYGGLGMYVDQEKATTNTSGVEASAVIDLVRGQISAAYGGSLSQGMTRRTIVNVPKTATASSTIVLNNIFGGAYGEDPLKPCDVYQSIVNYNSGDARVNGAIYGGNNSADRTLYTQVNINAPVKQSNGYDGYAYGAGYGKDTWAQYTEVNINNGGSVYEVYGGGNAGQVLNQATVEAWKTATPSLDLTLGGDYTDTYLACNIAQESQLNKDKTARAISTAENVHVSEKYNTNVLIHEGGVVKNYAYGGGLGTDAVVSGSTYIALLGGTVNKDIYAAGTSGDIRPLHNADFKASTTAYVRGGTCRNVYGGGWRGSVGYHDPTKAPTTNDDLSTDILGESNVIIGNLSGNSFLNGIPAIKRNAYGGGEGGGIYGTAYTTLFNGYVGYNYDSSRTDNITTTAFDEHYEEELDDKESGDNQLYEAGNIFGGGYVANSYVDISKLTMYGGVVRNSLYGGGEIGPIGRGTVKDGLSIAKAGESHVYLYKGYVKRNVFGGGRGFDSWNGNGWMTDEEKVTMDLSSKGYVFGSTDVNIYGGEIGTDEGIGHGYGNVFGGGNIGYVYTKAGTKNDTDGYYYDSSSKLTEDCRVVIKPYCQVTSGTVTHSDKTYAVGDYVPTEVLDTYAYNHANWNNLDNTGITIHNAVFAGGNVSTGSDQVYANTETVFGNATASVIDIFDKDLITVGEDGIGGLYGEGNLTFVDGYRELNITNYGTDYNHLDKSLTYEDYQNLNKRQKAYYELKYRAKNPHTYTYYMSKATHNYNNVTYRKGQKITQTTYNSLSSEEQTKWKSGSTSYAVEEQITENEYDLMDEEERAHWELYGFCTLFEGRMINTIQRADFCGVFGSRIVLRGAQDRVPSVVDYTDYTINRVKELSLNKQQNTSVNATNGNYFGIYNVVNYLGALTSDVHMDDVRTTTSDQYPVDATYKTYNDYKHHNLNNRSRNNGTSLNEVALSSGVWLEILDESTETAGKKVYGPITGVVQLDLINVATGEGGGYVYAKNIHGVRSASEANQVTLAAANQDANSYKKWTYAAVTTEDKMQTSGNFINPLKRIIDDCYPTSGAFYGEKAAPAHYWFVRGDFYVYDQYISAYTGSTQAYAEVVSIPLTITAESQGKLKLESVKPNLYAFWNDATVLPKYKSKTEEGAIIVGGVTYHKNDPISYWTWSHLTEAEQELFWDGQTYVCTNAATYNSTTYKAGDVLTSKPADIYVCTQTFTLGETTYTEGESVITATEYAALDEVSQSHFAVVFNPTNVVSHDRGFVLTFDWDNPDVWNDYYHKVGSDDKIRASQLSPVTEDYTTSPSYKCTTGGVYGQVTYSKGDIIGEAVHSKGPNGQSTTFAEAYVAKANCQFTNGGTNHQYVKGACISSEDYGALNDENKGYFDVGYLCDETYAKSETEYYLYGEVIPASEYNTLHAAEPTVSNNFSKAYICTIAGKWGGDTFVEGNSYPAIKFSNLSADERKNFTFNYDAFDLLIDDDYNNVKKYDSAAGTNEILYAKQQSIDYIATYNGEGITLTNSVDITRNGSAMNTNQLQTGDVLSNTVYESLVNEQYNYTPIVVQGGSVADNYYVVKESFQVGDKAYIPGNQIKEDVYNTLSDANKNKISVVASSTLSSIEALPTGTDVKRYYFCTKAYSDNSVGSIISSDAYGKLTNEQRGFTIDGLIPSETSTLYVAREANIDELSQDKIITVAYWYDYVESDETGNSYENIREKHVVNVHIHFESGVPTIGELLPPNIVLPGDMLSLNKPAVTKGAYEILGGGWEIFPNESEAVSHQNGVAYTNYTTPMYWYQDGYWVAYYAKSYLGKTYSNPVKISVANYHRMNNVMTSTHEVIENETLKHVRDYMYLDDAVKIGKRNPKVYIGSTNELDYLKKFYDLTKENDTLSNVKDCKDIDFIVDHDIDHSESWTSIGDEYHCFEGTLHGDGYTISGLNSSLFNHLCGSVYNLGVKGTFTGAGVAETGDGYVENCWISTTNTAAKTSKPVFGTPNASNGIQIVNSYYREDDDAENKYDTHSGNYGKPTKKSSQAFYNGEVAYDLNGFYLYKRYCDQKVSSGAENQAYKNYTVNDDNTLTLSATKYYADNMSSALCSSGYNGIKYVEDRFADGDFIYAGGSIPETADERLSEDNYYPIWPHDYIFFGQTLNYGHIPGRSHQDLPAHIKKTGNRILAANGNRVFRAPAYFQSKDMGVAHYNPDAIFAEKSKDGTREAYPDMTAIDFTGFNETAEFKLGASSAAPYNNITAGAFYPPLLDNDGLESFANIDETKNLLVYIPQATTTATTKTNTAVTEHLVDPTYAETNATYRTVAKSTATINGHRVVKNAEGNGYTALVDHFLVDKEDFNAPIAYTFAAGKRMWYQRTPDTYVDLEKGWEGISIPFSAELVTTQTKGEITHFYGKSNSVDENGTKVGHEYWLRELTGNVQPKKDENGDDVGGVYTADFNYPGNGSEGNKSYTNTFLWDYYYSKSTRHDENTDQYQQYYNASHTYKDYGYSTAAKPYIIGFPGKTYYEFDLSGEFQPQNTYASIDKLAQQVITFVSKPAVTIAVSDDELSSAVTTHNGYSFTPNYLAKSLAAGAFTMKDDGSAYQKTSAETTTVPFRPYFTAAAGARSYDMPEMIVFTRGINELDPSVNEEQSESLKIYAKRGKIVAESHLKKPVTIQIHTLAGISVKTFVLQPETTVETPIRSTGVYIVNKRKMRVEGL